MHKGVAQKICSLWLRHGGKQYRRIAFSGLLVLPSGFSVEKPDGNMYTVVVLYLIFAIPVSISDRFAERFLALNMRACQ